MADNITTVLDRIEELIKTKGMSYRAFSASIGTPPMTLSSMLKRRSDPSALFISTILSVYPEVSSEWLLLGKGTMFKSESSNIVAEPSVEYGKKQTRPRIPYTAAAGSLTSAVEGITADQCEQIPRINIFPEYDFTIIIKGNSMEPKYEGGDEVACKRIDSTSFIQWGKVHVLDTAQGILIKRTYEDGEKIRCVSYNPEYPDFSIDKNEIYSMSLVVGLVRL